MIWFILAGLALSHAAALVAGGYLHYRFGSTVVSTARVLEAAVLTSKK
jgi:hypothetical protein